MKCSVIIPTRDREECLARAIRTFLQTCEFVDFPIVEIVVIDDCTNAQSSKLLSDEVAKLTAEFNYLHIAIRQTGKSKSNNNVGHARNLGLAYLTNSKIEHEAVCMFDDDISFQNCEYQGVILEPSGMGLMKALKDKLPNSKTVYGCDYVGRQDLSFVEHAQLTTSGIREVVELKPSCIRGAIKHTAPSFVSGGFMFVPSSAKSLPAFLNIYNEDYFWLEKMKYQGWCLEQLPYKLAHAPSTSHGISIFNLNFEQVGEVVWAAYNMYINEKDAANTRDCFERALDERIMQLSELSNMMKLHNYIEVSVQITDVITKFVDLRAGLSLHGKKILSDFEGIITYVMGMNCFSETQRSVR